MKKPKHPSKTKRTIKYLSICSNPKLTRQIISESDQDVVKAICNAALNAQSGDVSLRDKEKKDFARFRDVFNRLTSRDLNLSQKRKLILRNQKGSGFFAIIPALLSSVLGAIGSSFLNRSSN